MNRLPTRWIVGVPDGFPFQPMEDLSAEAKFFAVAVHYYRTCAEANYPKGTITAAGRAFGLEDEGIQAVTNSANDYVIRGCQPDRRSKFRPVPSETSNVQLLQKAA